MRDDRRSLTVAETATVSSLINAEDWDRLKTVPVVVELLEAKRAAGVW